MAGRTQQLKDHWKEQRLFLSRIISAAVMVVLLTGLLVWRLIDLQVVRYQLFSDLSQGNQIKIQALPPTRGVIYDRNGRVLAKNEPTWQLIAIPEDIEDLEATLVELERLQLLDPADHPAHVEKVRSQRSWQPVLLANLEERQAAVFAVRGHQFKGIDLQAGLVRFYQYGALTAHTIGYVSSISTSDYERIDRNNYNGTLQIGKTGIERAYEDRLHGSVGRRPLVVDARGRPTDESVPAAYNIDTYLPVPGENIYLSLDIRLQLAAQQALEGFRGAVVAIDPRNGDVLTFVSTPAFDPNSFATGMSSAEYSALTNDPNKPFLNRAMLSDRYYPGSTVKPFLALAALHYELDYLHEDHYCNGTFSLEGSTHQYREGRRVLPHGEVDLHSALVRSCNVFFYGLGVDLGIDRIEAFMRGFGFGNRTGIDISGESAGVNPGPEWKRANFRNREDQIWYPGETVNAAIGQGFTEVTPLQLASATATLAARGQRFQPRLLTAVENPQNGVKTELAPTAVTPIADVAPEHWDIVHAAMLGVTAETRGTGFKALGDAPYSVAGKTGTAQGISVAQGEVYEADAIDEVYRDNGLFIAFAPAENPEIAIAVIVENQGGGGTMAAPVARKVFDTYFGGTEYVAQLVSD